MENRAYALSAGTFTLLLGIAVIVTAMWLSGNTYERVLYTLESKHGVSGLNLQAPVRLRGVEVGKVESIAFDAADRKLVLVGIGVRTGTPITRGTVAQLGSQGVTGLAYVMLEDDGSKPDPLPPGRDAGARIPVRPSFLDELSGSGKDLVTEVNQIARKLNLLLGEKNQAQLLRTLAGLESATERVAVLARALEPGVKGVPGLVAEARTTLTGAQALFTEIAELSRAIKKEASAMERIAKSAEQIGGAADAVSGVAVGETVPRLNALLDELARTSRNVDRLITELNEQPQGLVFGRSPPRPGPGEPGHNPQGSAK